MREKKIKSVVPIYAAAAAWLVYSLIFPLYRLFDFLIIIAAVLLVYALFKKLFPGKTIQIPEPEPPPKTLDPELENILNEGKTALSEMGRLYASIPQTEVKAKIMEIMNISEKIVKNAEQDPANIPTIQKFLSYYLPTTIKILNAYDRMYAQGISGENISGTITRIEDMLDTIVTAYENQLDALFKGSALDIETDIVVMDGMLKREGLKGSDFEAVTEREE